MFEYKVKLDRVVDGDTLDVFIDLGFKIHTKKRIRLHGINTPESRTRNKAEKVLGLAAKARLKEILYDAEEIRLVSLGVGKYGRVLGVLYIGLDTKETIDSDTLTVQQQLIDEGHGVEYHGGKR